MRKFHLVPNFHSYSKHAKTAGFRVSQLQDIFGENLVFHFKDFSYGSNCLLLTARTSRCSRQNLTSLGEPTVLQ